MYMSKGIVSSCNSFGILDLHSCLLHPHIELIILSAPPPKQVREPVHLHNKISHHELSQIVPYLLKLCPRHDQYPSHEGLVVIEWVEFWRGDMEGSLCWELVDKFVIKWEEIDIMHDHIVTFTPAHKEANIEKSSTVEP